MRIHQILESSRANGPGLRFVIWVQGCSRKCPGCFNPATHDKNEGYEAAVSEIVNMIPAGEITGLTVSGGEPFEQPGELAKLLEEAGKKKLNRLVYTGFTYDELIENENHLFFTCLSQIDILVDGAYIKEIPVNMPWTGSGNQRVLKLHNGKIQKVFTGNDFDKARFPDGELIINQNGEITATGLIDFS